jgi:hypothetical protein
MEESVVLQSDDNPFPYLNRIIFPKLLNFPCFNRIIFSVLTVYQVSAVLLPCLNYLFPSVTRISSLNCNIALFKLFIPQCYPGISSLSVLSPCLSPVIPLYIFRPYNLPVSIVSSFRVSLNRIPYQSSLSITNVAVLIHFTFQVTWNNAHLLCLPNFAHLTHFTLLCTLPRRVTWATWGILWPTLMVTSFTDIPSVTSDVTTFVIIW